MIKLQRCTACGTAQYPPREICADCLSDQLTWETTDSLPARVLACTRLHHSNEPPFRPRLPLTVGLVQFAAGPVAVCFLPPSTSPGNTVQVRIGPDDLLEAT